MLGRRRIYYVTQFFSGSHSQFKDLELEHIYQDVKVNYLATAISILFIIKLITPDQKEN